MKTNVFMNAGLVCTGLTSAVAPALAQITEDPPERVVITASLLGAVRSDLLGSSATVLNPIDLENRQTRIVSDILRDVPGVAVSGLGVGQFTNVRLRGAEANHTLALIDGMKVSDPFAGEFDFGTLMADEIARVEVLRGEQSALYGSDAIGGVVHYITLTGAEAPGIRARAEGGSFGTANTALRVAGVTGDLDYSFNAVFNHTDGTIDNEAGERKLRSETLAASGKLIYSFAPNFRVKAQTRYNILRSDANDQDFRFPPNPTYGLEIDSNGHFKTTSWYGLAGAEFEGAEGHWRNSLTIQFADLERNAFGGLEKDPDFRASGNKGGRTKATFVTSYDFGTMAVAHKLTGAVDWEEERYQNTSPDDPANFLVVDRSKRSSHTYGYVGEYNLTLNNRFAISAAGRYDNNYKFDDSFTYRVQASYLLDGGFRLHAATGTGVKAPGVYELYGFMPPPGGFISNPDLKPEKSEGYEAGVEVTFLGGNAVADVTYFNSRLKDEIAIEYIGQFFDAHPYNTAADSPRDGVETSLSFRLARQWRIDAAYTYLHSEENGLPEVRRPENIASLNVAWRSMDDMFGANLTVRYNGEQKDFQFTPFGSDRITLDSYTLVNLGADYKINDRWQIYGRLENLFDTEYQEVFSFLSPGRGVYAGLRATLQ
jgi:vitamin B12 transporter